MLPTSERISLGGARQRPGGAAAFHRRHTLLTRRAGSRRPPPPVCDPSRQYGREGPEQQRDGSDPEARRSLVVECSADKCRELLDAGNFRLGQRSPHGDRRVVGLEAGQHVGRLAALLLDGRPILQGDDTPCAVDLAALAPTSSAVSLSICARRRSRLSTIACWRARSRWLASLAFRDDRRPPLHSGTRRRTALHAGTPGLCETMGILPIPTKD
jgi:hypothetical protein